MNNIAKLKQKQKIKEQTKQEDKSIKLKDEVEILVNYYHEIKAYGEDDEYFIRTALETFNKEDIISALSYAKQISTEEASIYVENILKQTKQQPNKETPSPDNDIM
ncbi:MAG: hypothetical protein ACP5M8_08055, partial [Caldisphaera sp.]